MNQFNSHFIKYRNDFKCCFCFCSFLFPITLCLNFFTFNSTLTDSYRFGILLSLDVTLITLFWKHQLLNNINILVFSNLVTLLGLFLTTDTTFWSFIYLFVINLIIKKCINSVSAFLASSFTICELTIVLQVSFTFLAQSSICFLNGLDLVNVPASCSAHEEVKVLQILFFGLFWITLTVISCNKYKSNTLLNYVTLAVGVLGTYFFISILIQKEAILWVLNFITNSTQRVWLITSWGFLFAITLIFCSINFKFRQTILRKFFHIMMIIVYTLGIRFDINLLYFISAALLWVFLLVEVLRIIDQKYASKVIDTLLDKFRNQNDQGLLTLSHIYLLIGFSSPLWLSSTFDAIPINLIAGLITIGYGDTAASVIGSLFGKHKWPSGCRSYEGTFAAIMAQILGVILTCLYLNKDINIIMIIISSIITSLIEAKTVQVDNFILPFYFNITWLFYKCCLKIVY